MLLQHFTLIGIAAAVPFGAPVPHERRDISRFALDSSNSRRVHPDAILPIRVALTQSNLHKGYDYLMQVSDPDSESFGRHWTVEEVHEHFAPSTEAQEAVIAWLESAGIHREDIQESTSAAWLGIDIPASLAESLFSTEYYETHGANSAVAVGCDEYHVPSHLSHHIDFVTPGIGDTTLQKRSRRLVPRALGSTILARDANNFTDAPCGTLMTPACLRALYDIPDHPPRDCDGMVGMGIFEFIDTYDQEDLDLFYQYFANNIPSGTHPILDSINNATAPVNTSSGGSESIIDFTLAFSFLYPQNITLYQTGFTDAQKVALVDNATGPLLNQLQIAGAIASVENLLNAVDGPFCTADAREQGLDCGTTSLAPVLSASYSSPEISFPVKFAQRACNEYMKLGLMGHTLVFASGDFGPAGNAIRDGNNSAVSNACINLDDPQNGVLNGTVFNPGFPATCPYVLTVGATQLNTNDTVKDPEHVMYKTDLGFPSYVNFSSSGGFSNYFEEPSYQAAAVSNYTTNHDAGYKTYPFPNGSNIGADGGIHAKGGRAFPDIAANGANLASFLAGQFAPNDGTSLSTPIIASMITRINSERAAMGKGPVGFINPTLYQNPSIFNDITSGNAPGCGTNGFAATPGWDPTTGLGTPRYPELLKLLAALP